MPRPLWGSDGASAARPPGGQQLGPAGGSPALASPPAGGGWLDNVRQDKIPVGGM